MAGEAKLDFWLQRAAVAAMVALALGLLAVGIVLYARPAHASPAPVTNEQELPQTAAR